MHSQLRRWSLRQYGQRLEHFRASSFLHFAMEILNRTITEEGLGREAGRRGRVRDARLYMGQCNMRRTSGKFHSTMLLDGMGSDDI